MIIIITIISIFHIISSFCFRSLGLIRNILHKITGMALFLFFFWVLVPKKKQNSIKYGKKEIYVYSVVANVFEHLQRNVVIVQNTPRIMIYRNCWYTLTAVKYLNMCIRQLSHFGGVYQIRKQCLSRALIGWFGSNQQVLFASEHTC